MVTNLHAHTPKGRDCDKLELELELLQSELKILTSLVETYKKENETLRNIIKDQWRMLKGYLGLD